MKTFDLTTIYHEERPLSWSAISSFEWNPTQWYKKYVLKELPIDTPELRFGSMIDKKVQDDPTFLPELVRYPVLQHEMRTIFDGIPLLGFADTYRPRVRPAKGRESLTAALRDYKTGRKPWDQKRANETGQLTMYLLMLWQQHKIRPEDVECYIDWLPTHIKDGEIAFIEPVKIHTFKTKRTMHELLTFGQRIKDTYAAMEEYAGRQADMVTSDMDGF